MDMLAPPLVHALDEFGASLGLPRLGQEFQDAMHLPLAGGGELGLSLQGGDLVLHMAEPVRHGAAEGLLRLMKLADATAQPPCPPGHPPPFSLQPGLHAGRDGDLLVLAIRLPVPGCDANRLRDAADRLRHHLSARS